MSGPILPISNPSRDSINVGLRLDPSSSSPSSSSTVHRPLRTTPLHNPQTQESLTTAAIQADITSSPRRSIASIRTQPSAMAMAPAPGKGGQNGGSPDEPWQTVELEQVGLVDKPVNETHTLTQQQEEGEGSDYAHLIGTSFDETGKLWPEIRKLKVMTIKTGEELGIFKDLSKSEQQYQYSLQAGSYLRFVCTGSNGYC